MATRGRGQPRECPVEHRGKPCGARVAAGRLMCPYHWAKVPRAQRRAVYAAWQTWTDTHADSDWDAYLDARAVALTAATT